MSDVWINAFVALRTHHTDEELKQIGQAVINALQEQWEEDHKSSAKQEPLHCTEITVGTS